MGTWGLLLFFDREALEVDGEVPGGWVIIEFCVKNNDVGVFPSVFVGEIMHVQCVGFEEVVGGVLLECFDAVVYCSHGAAQGGEYGLLDLFLCHCFRSLGWLLKLYSVFKGG